MRLSLFEHVAGMSFDVISSPYLSAKSRPDSTTDWQGLTMQVRVSHVD